MAARRPPPFEPGKRFAPTAESLTAHSMQDDRERCRAAGMDAFVTKPIRASELFEAI